MSSFLERAKQSARSILDNNRSRLARIVAQLLERETIEGAELTALLAGHEEELSLSV